MSVGPNSLTCVPPLGQGDEEHRQVLASFLLCQLTEEDLTQNPLFCRLLGSLSQHVDHTGLTLPLRRELEKAEQELQLQRLGWLRSEGLFQALQEMIQEHFVRKYHSSTTAENEEFYETLEQCLLVAQAVRQLDPSPTVGQDQLPFLGLSAQNILDRMPSGQDVQRMKQRLLTALSGHLKKKCFTILTYYQPDWENESDPLKSLKLSRLPEILQSESRKAESLGEKSKESAALLQRHMHCYLSELLGCIQIIQSLILDHRIKAQKELDVKRVEYLDAKCQIVTRKIRLEILELQMDTYTTEKIAAHRRIRNELDGELSAVRAEKRSVESALSSFEILGRDFEALVEQYSRLLQEIDNKSWAVKEFSQHAA
ncbi:hypothetical protein AAFF_G00112050 [Aldrovandia affinis]|uniref:HAUS augmin-like complex subunit 4 n=1 Tax=Aldrovandia affinis TaxID=143900 RepID=A0AAD7WBP7_9TELE|nr:hypothetical protein AAFF_G00112050 [Aldrovandia affinis]